MSNVLDVFRQDAFSVVSLTDAILKVPYKPSRIGELKLFRERGIATTKPVVEEKLGRLALIQSSPRGAPAATPLVQMKRTARVFQCLHLEKDTKILADELQGVRAFGSGSDTGAVEMSTVQAAVNERLSDLRAQHEVTLEYQRACAIQGKILDADGTTVYDLFTEFDVSQQTATLSPDSSKDNGNVLRSEIVQAQRLSEAELGGDPITDWLCLCGRTFFDDLRDDLGVTQTLRWADPMSLTQQTPGVRSFRFGGVAFEEYRYMIGGEVTRAKKFIADDEGYLIPIGPPIFDTYFAPADYVETINTIGLPMYAKQYLDPELQRFVRIHTQSNPLSLCLRPRAVIKMTAST